MNVTKRLWFQILIIISTWVAIFTFWIYSRELSKKSKFYHHKQINGESIEELDKDKHPVEMLDELLACKMPKLDAFDASITKYRIPPKHKYIECNITTVFFEANFMSKPPSIVQINDLAKNWGPCCYKHLVYKSKYNYNKLSPGVCMPLQSTITPVPPETEYVHIVCNKTLTFEFRNHTSKPFFHEEILTFIPVKSKIVSNDKNPSRITETPNVLMIGFDHNSRLNFIREMPKTYEYIMKTLGAIEMMGFNKMGDATFNNTNAFLMGLSYTELKQTCWTNERNFFDDCPFIWKDFKQNGYLTSLSDDLQSVYRYRFKGFKKQPTDYYLQPFITRMPNASTISSSCIGALPKLLLIPENIKKTAWSLRNKPYFQFAWQSRVHTGLALIGLTDKPWKETLTFLQEKRLLNNTIVILISDHGWRLGKIMYTPQGRYENRMPFAYFIFPKWFKEKYSAAVANIRENAKRLTTPYDIHSTLKDLADLRQISSKTILASRTSVAVSYPKRGISLFLPIPRNRTCKSAGIDEHWCTCDSYKDWPNSSPLSLTIGRFAVSEINSWLRPFPNCSQFRLKHINKFDVKTENIHHGESESKRFNAFKIIFSVKPGYGEFDATVFRRPNGSLTMSTEISRINSYGKQSECINVYMMNKICYCGYEIHLKRHKKKSKKKKHNYS